MKALVLAGGLPQTELINKLKAKGIETVLADYYEHPVARDHADKFYRISTLDVDAIRQLAIDENVDFIITVCTDQALLTMAEVSEDLGLPCYMDFETARNVTNKAYMKKVFAENNIPSARFVTAGSMDELDTEEWRFPLIVKPVDCNSSKGVRRADNKTELESAFSDAVRFSRTNTAIVEKFITGKELSVDVYTENGKAIVLDITTSEKLKVKDRFIIFRTWHPANISEAIKNSVQKTAQKISDSFGLKDSPMLIQMLSDGKEAYVIEFSARTGGGVKHLSIGRRSGVDIISAVIDLTLGQRPHIEVRNSETKYMVDEYIYCKPGIFDHIEGFKELKECGIITDYYEFCWKGTEFDSVENSGNRVGGFTIEGNTMEELRCKHDKVINEVRIISDNGSDMMRRDLLMDFDATEA